MNKFDIFMNRAVQSAVVIQMQDDSIEEIIRDDSGDSFSSYDNIEDFITYIMTTDDPMRDFNQMFKLDNGYLELVREQYPDAVAVYWGEL